MIAFICALPAYKYTFTVYDGQIIKLNTQNGTFERCDADFKCESVATK